MAKRSTITLLIVLLAILTYPFLPPFLHLFAPPAIIRPVSHSLPPQVPPSPAPSISSQASPPQRTMQAYQIALRAGVLSLAGTELLAGDFHRRRGPMPWQPGMWCIRVLDADQRPLAQETTPAPDQPCVVLDPHAAAPGEPPKATPFKATDDVLTQVRMAATPGAKWLKIYRLASANPAPLSAEPIGQLLATLPLGP